MLKTRAANENGAQSCDRSNEGQRLEEGRAIGQRKRGKKGFLARARSRRRLRQDPTAFRCEPDGIKARIALGAPALEPSVRNQPTYKVGGARPVDARCRHDIGLAQTVRLADRLKDGELTRRGDIADVARKQA